MFPMGLTGGITGLIAAGVVYFVSGLGSAFSLTGADDLAVSAISALLFSIAGILGAALCREVPRFAGVMMIIAGLGGFVVTFMAFILPGTLLVIAGVMGFVSPPVKREESLSY